jgi:predicted ATP-grasp superfamily ATP-dependent carboligase
MMAESAQRGGYAATALDLFGDTDTRRVVDAWCCVGDPSALRLDRDRVLHALAACARSANFIGWVAGAGFEGVPELLARGAASARLIGNGPDTHEAIRTPRDFFRRLAALGIPHPAIAWEAPTNREGWLCKDSGGSGGWHIRAANAADRRHPTPVHRIYYQRVHPGVPMSALFIADGTRAHVIGVNELVIRSHGSRPYVYHGAIGPVPVSPRVLRDIRQAVEAIAREWHLVGLNGVDFLLNDETIVVLEVNARPTATLALYDHVFPRGAVRAHVDACLTQSLQTAAAAQSHGVRGHAIVFAQESVPAFTTAACERMLALGWVHDVPFAGSATTPGAPLCSVSANGRSVSDVRAALSAREREVIALVAAAKPCEAQKDR